VPEIVDLSERHGRDFFADNVILDDEIKQAGENGVDRNIVRTTLQLLISCLMKSILQSLSPKRPNTVFITVTDDDENMINRRNNHLACVTVS